MTPEQRLAALNIILPPATIPAGHYLAARLVGNMLHLSGQGPRDAHGGFLTGRLGGDISVEEGYVVARNVGLQLVSAAKAALGDLSRVDAIIKVFGWHGEC